MKKQLSLKSTLYSLMVIFIILLAYCTLQIVWEFNKFYFPVLAVLAILFLIFGIILIFKAKKHAGKLKFSLMLTGFSAIAPLIFSVLHNVFYGLAIVFESFNLFFEILHGASFLISIIVAPLTFIISWIISLILLNNNHK